MIFCAPWLTSLSIKCFSPFRQHWVLRRVFSSPSSKTVKHKHNIEYQLYSIVYKILRFDFPSFSNLPTVYMLQSVNLLITASIDWPVSGFLYSTVEPTWGKERKDYNKSLKWSKSMKIIYKTKLNCWSLPISYFQRSFSDGVISHHNRIQCLFQINL